MYCRMLRGMPSPAEHSWQYPANKRLRPARWWAHCYFALSQLSLMQTLQPALHCLQDLLSMPCIRSEAASCFTQWEIWWLQLASSLMQRARSSRACWQTLARIQVPEAAPLHSPPAICLCTIGMQIAEHVLVLQHSWRIPMHGSQLKSSCPWNRFQRTCALAVHGLCRVHRGLACDCMPCVLKGRELCTSNPAFPLHGQNCPHLSTCALC